MTTATATDRQTREDRAEIGRRVRAARFMAGHALQADLSAAIRDNGGRVSRESIRDIEAGRRLCIQPHELQYIAEACGVPVEFFTADLHAYLATPSLEDRVEALEHRMDSVRRGAERVG